MKPATVARVRTLPETLRLIPESLRRFREKRDMRIVDLAGLTGIRPQELCRYESGRVPALPELLRIADALRVGLDRLIGRKLPKRGKAV